MSALEEDVAQLAANLHAATCLLARKCAELDDSGDWRGVGLASCAHWLAINAGYDLWTAAELLRVGHALQELPLIAAAFAEGRLSFDKVRALVQVARPSDDHIWLDVALQASGSQLARICRAFRRSTEADDPDRALAQQRKRRLVTWWREDGMLELFATLPPEDAAVVLNAIQAALLPPAADGAESATPEADHPAAARRADALVAVCREALTQRAAGVERDAAPRQIVVHVDAQTLRTAGDGGRCHIEDGPALSVATARRLGCDADLLSVVERDSVPVATSRGQRLISGRKRRLLQLRDETCRFPGCSVAAARTDGHHIRHWIDGGGSELSNLASLCAFHHQRHHEGEFEIEGDANRPLRFVTREGREIGRTYPASCAGGMDALRQVISATAPVTAESPRAGDGGRPCDLAHAVEVLAHNT
ncbi:MAG: DUF222 domain-containing protein, partial [Candidatus Dormibacteraeota bacterium]|nr:DUF222 domain-containing protein [Candidatus Dormibacteraeota bacterium]